MNSFRWDLQGLRALAVLSVVIYHISPDMMPGGFIGVDIFFVISGYLIIGSIYKDLENNCFSLNNFYVKRIKRLYPALISVVIVSSIAAYFYFIPIVFKDYIYSVISSLFYFSNFWFYSKSGYFDSDLEIQPLLHTWSLSVEEQFYICFPIILMVIFYFFPRKKISALILLFILSIILCFILTHTNETLAFYASPARFWQFIAGGVISVSAYKFAQPRFIRELLVFISISILILAFFQLTPENFPGLKAVIPTFCTVLIIVFCKKGDTSYLLLSNFVAKFIGNISYSLYLWHWPVIVFYKLHIDHELYSRYEKLPVLLISIILSYLTYILIENPARKLNLRPNTIYLSTIGSVILLIVSIKLLSIINLNKFDAENLKYEKFLSYSAEALYREGDCFLTSKSNNFKQFNKNLCIAYKKGKNNLLLIGDSHSAHWYQSIANILNVNNSTLTQANASGCMPFLAPKGEKRCTDLMSWIFSDLVIENSFNTIIISARWTDNNIDELIETISFLRNYANQIIILGPIVEYKKSLPEVLVRSTGSEEIKKYQNYNLILGYDKKLSAAMSKIADNVYYIPVIDLVCPNAQCITTTDTGIPLQFDYGHLTAEGADLLMRKIMPNLKLINAK